MSRVQPSMNPEDPTRKGTEQINATEKNAINQENSLLNIDKLFPDKPLVPQYESPYNVNGGGNMKKYRFMSKPGEFSISGRNPMDALQNGLVKLENENADFYNQRKQITVNLQKESNRVNKIHKFMMKIFRIDHPVYRYKIELWKF